MVHYCELMKDALIHPGNPFKLFTGCCKYDPDSPVHQKVGQCMAWMIYISLCFDGSALVYCWVTANVIWLTGICWFCTALLFLFCAVYFIANCMKLGMFIMWLMEMVWWVYILYVIVKCFQNGQLDESQKFWFGIAGFYFCLLYPQACLITYCFRSARELPSFRYVQAKK